VRLADEIAPWHAPHAVKHMELRPGQFFLTWGGLWHGVGANHTKSPRVAAVARYARTDMECRDYGFNDFTIEKGEKLPCLLVSGKDDFGLNDIREAPQDDFGK